MKKPAYAHLVEKSRAACIAAVETYNRALSPYREETFAILMINAWELLLKARVMKENGGKRKSIFEYHKPKTKKGTSAREIIKRGRSGAPLTIGIVRAYGLCRTYSKHRVDEACINNIEALLEIRDCATHFVTKTAKLAKTLSEISLAAVKNYVLASQQWFGVSYSDLNIASIPLSFSLDQMELEAVAKRTPAEVIRFLAEMDKLEQASAAAPASMFAFSVRVEFDLSKKPVPGAMIVQVVNDGADLKISLGDQVPAAFSWRYDKLSAYLAKRYSNFKQNEDYHKLRKKLEADKALCHLRLLDPKNTKSPKTRFYNPNIVQHFDKHYTLKSIPVPGTGIATNVFS